MVRVLLILLTLGILFFSCKKEEEIKPTPEPLGLKAVVVKTFGDFEPGTNLKSGSSYSSKTCNWIVNFQAESGILSYSVKVNGFNLSGYPKRPAGSVLQKRDTVSYSVKRTDTDTLKFEFITVDKLGETATTTYKLYVKNFKLYKDLYLFTQNVVPADTIGKNLKASNIGCYFSTLTQKSYTNATGQNAGNLIDLGIMGVDNVEYNGNNYNGIHFVSNDRRFVLGGDVLPQALPFKIVGSVTWSPDNYFYTLDWFNFNNFERFYSNNAEAFVTDESSYYKFLVTNRCEGMIRIKEIGSLSSPVTNTKKYIKFDMKVYYF